MPTTTRRAVARPPNLEQLQPTCGVTSTSTNSDNTLLAQVECDTRLATCPPGATYPPQTGVHLGAAAGQPAHDGQPVLGCPHRPVVPGRRRSGIVAWRVARPWRTRTEPGRSLFMLQIEL